MLKEILKRYKEKEEAYTKEIKETFIYYTRSVSTENMAASLRSCVLLGCMMEVMKPKRAMDLGSGISSYALRYFKSKFKYTTEIYSVDSDWDWLKKSRDFSHVREVDSNHFYHWTEVNLKKIPFEIIFMDIDRTKARLNYYEPVCKQFTKKGTLMLIDDMHKGILREKVKKIKVPHIRHNVHDETRFKKGYNWILEFTGAQK